jgi:MSHA pilin protein MshA
MKKQRETSKFQGFTLIELMAAILIVGALAAAALPKFVDMGKEARVAAVQRLGAELITAANLVRAKCDASDLCRGQTYPSGFFIDGISADLVNGYPSARAGQPPDGSWRNGNIGVWIKTNGFNLVQHNSGHMLTFYMPVSGANNNGCYARYAESWGPAPSVSIVTSGC